MTLKERLEADYKKAFKEKNKLAVDTLRLLKAEVKNAELEKRKDFDDNEVLDVIIKVAKKHKDSKVAFEKGNRQDLAKREEEQSKILDEYLPDKLSEEELQDIICELIVIAKAESKKDMGKVMGLVMKKTKNQADGNMVKKIVMEELGRADRAKRDELEGKK